MLITTTPGIEGRPVIEYVGIVTAQGVLASHARRNPSPLGPRDKPITTFIAFKTLNRRTGASGMPPGRWVPTRIRASTP